MKKFIAAMVSALAALALCICLAACSAKGVEGTYKFSSVKMTNGTTTVEYKVGEKYFNDVVLNETSFVLTMNGDNTWEMKQDIGVTATQTGTWEEKEGKYYLSVTDQNSVMEATLDGNTITVSMDGTTVVLIK